MPSVLSSRPAPNLPLALPDRDLAALRALERRRRARLRAWLYRRVAVLAVWLLWVDLCWAHRQALTALLPRANAAPVAPALAAPAESLVCLPSARRLSKTDLAAHSDWELTLMRNEPYARHGYRFGQGQGGAAIYAYFARLPWYRPDTRDLDVCWERLSKVEQANAFLLLRYQKQRRGYK